jgi:hypothetical protein
MFYDGTYYSENLEKHAAPPSMTGYRNIKLNRKYIPKFILNYLRKGQYPKCVLHIHDTELLELSKELNKEFYNTEIKENPRNINHTINNIKVKNIHCFCKQGQCLKKTMFEKILGKNCAKQDDIMCYGNCKHTIFAAAKRQLKSAPTPDPEVADDFIKFSKSFIDKYIGEELKHFGYSYNSWYNHLTKDKQQRMDTIRKLLEKEETGLLTREEKDFLKMQYTGICKIELEELDGKPRMVCSIPDLIKYVMGPITWHLEEIFAEKFPGYCGGKNLNEMADVINEYIDQGFTKVVEGDGSAFDNTQDVLLKEVDRYIYRLVMHSIYHVPKKLFEKISQSVYKTMLIKYRDVNKKLKTMMQYSILGTVFSGDCDTTLCNTARMALYNHYVNYKAGLKLHLDYELFSKGDDFTVMYKPYILNQFIEDSYYKYFLKASQDPSVVDDRCFGLGQVCKFLHFGDQSTFTFCSLRSWICDKYGHVVLTRDPKKFITLAKYARKTKIMTLPQLVIYLIDQAIALTSSYKGIELFDRIAQRYVSEANKIRQAYTKKMLIKEQNLMEKRIENPDSRSTLPAEDINDILLNDIQYRKVIHKIKGSYWQTMKAIEAVNKVSYTPEQLSYINKAVNAEFDPNIILNELQ